MINRECPNDKRDIKKTIQCTPVDCAKLTEFIDCFRFHLTDTKQIERSTVFPILDLVSKPSYDLTNFFASLMSLNNFLVSLQNSSLLFVLSGWRRCLRCRWCMLMHCQHSWLKKVNQNNYERQKKIKQEFGGYS